MIRTRLLTLPSRPDPGQGGGPVQGFATLTGILLMQGCGLKLQRVLLMGLAVRGAPGDASALAAAHRPARAVRLPPNRPPALHTLLGRSGSLAEAPRPGFKFNLLALGQSSNMMSIEIAIFEKSHGRRDPGQAVAGRTSR